MKPPSTPFPLFHSPSPPLLSLPPSPFSSLPLSLPILHFPPTLTSATTFCLRITAVFGLIPHSSFFCWLLALILLVLLLFLLVAGTLTKHTLMLINNQNNKPTIIGHFILTPLPAIISLCRYFLVYNKNYSYNLHVPYVYLATFHQIKVLHAFHFTLSS